MLSVVGRIPSVGMPAVEPDATHSNARGGGQPGTPVRVLVLRHGQSEWNAVRRWQGGADSPLTELGRIQAIETAWQLAGLTAEFVSLWSSDLRRASETASIIGDALGLGAPRIDRRLREADAGEWEGLTPDEIELRWPGWLAAHHRPPSFEPFDAVVERAVAALRDVAAHSVFSTAGAHTDGAAALVVAHSGVIRSLIRHLGQHDGRVPNLGGVWLTIEAEGAVGADGTMAASPVRSTTTGTVDGMALTDVFDPHGIVVSGVDAPGEDPGEQADEADAHGGAQH